MIKQTNGRDNAMIHRYQVYIFPKVKTTQDILGPVVIGRESTEAVDDNTNQRGARMVFPVMNSIDTWEKSKC